MKEKKNETNDDGDFSIRKKTQMTTVKRKKVFLIRLDLRIGFSIRSDLKKEKQIKKPTTVNEQEIDGWVGFEYCDRAISKINHPIK